MTQADVTDADRDLLYNLAINLECGRSRIEREQLVANHRITARNAALKDAAKVTEQMASRRFTGDMREMLLLATKAIRALMTKEPK